MAFSDFPEHGPGVRLIQRSMEHGRLGHAYLFAGQNLTRLEDLSRTLAKVLNCQKPVRSQNQAAIDCCDACPSCQKTDHETHPDVHWIRPESKSRFITIDQMRDLMQQINLKSTEGGRKIGIIVAADRMNAQAANAFLKTLEEPPSNSVFVLASTEPQRLLETIRSRCLRVSFTEDGPALGQEQMDWLRRFGEGAAIDRKSLIGRYRVLGILSSRLAEIRTEVDTALKARSPLTRYADQDIEPQTRDLWERELDAAIEADYRRRRSEVLIALEMWLRDVWIQTFSTGKDLLLFPELDSPRQVAVRLSTKQAAENLQVIEHVQRLLGTNVQEALALEVGLLRLHL